MLLWISCSASVVNFRHGKLPTRPRRPSWCFWRTGMWVCLLQRCISRQKWHIYMFQTSAWVILHVVSKESVERRGVLGTLTDSLQDLRDKANAYTSTETAGNVEIWNVQVSQEVDFIHVAWKHWVLCKQVKEKKMKLQWKTEGKKI